MKDNSSHFKRKMLLLLMIMLVLAVAGTVIVKAKGTKSKDVSEEKFTIVTSFYPVYIAVSNIVYGIDDVEVINLTENHSGCIHDYQLTTKDMRTISQADVFVMNGAGMEEFAEKALSSYPDIYVINSTEDMQLLEGHAHEHNHAETEDSHEHDESEHAETEDNHEHDESEHAETEDSHEHDETYNPHVWTSITLYCEQIEKITDELCRIDAKHAESYIKNKENYMARLSSVKNKTDELKKYLNGDYVVTFNDAFVYLAYELGMEVVHSVDLDEDSALSAGDIAEVIDEVKLHNIFFLWAEDSTAASISASISAETGAQVIILNPLTSGGKDIDAYIDGMEKNIDILMNYIEALK